MAVFDRSAIKSHGAKQRTTKQEKMDLIAQMEEVSRAEARQLYKFASEHKDMFTETEIAIYKAASEVGGLERYKRYEKKKERARLAGLKLSQLKPGAFEDDEEWEAAAWGGGRVQRTGLDGKPVETPGETPETAPAKTRRVRTRAQQASDRVSGAAKKPVAKRSTAKKSTAKKTTSSKSTAKKATAKKSTSKKTTVTKKTTGRASAAAKRVSGASKTSASAKKPTAAKKTTATKKTLATKKTTVRKTSSTGRAAAVAKRIGPSGK